jgi:hypothetical protein
MIGFTKEIPCERERIDPEIMQHSSALGLVEEAAFRVVGDVPGKVCLKSPDLTDGAIVNGCTCSSHRRQIAAPHRLHHEALGGLCGCLDFEGLIKVRCQWLFDEHRHAGIDASKCLGMMDRIRCGDVDRIDQTDPIIASRERETGHTIEVLLANVWRNLPSGWRQQSGAQRGVADVASELPCNVASPGDAPADGFGPCHDAIMAAPG